VTIKSTRITPQALADMIDAINANIITGKVAKDFIIPLLDGVSLADLIGGLQEKGGIISNRTELEKIIDDVINENPKMLEDYKKNPKAIGALIGEVMKKTDKRADPKLTREIILEKLNPASNNQEEKPKKKAAKKAAKKKSKKIN
jgi:aspartyl-tRNA(Asn)/glutamyl-tRNA(Gln) amidotransferase subunit B